VVAVVSTISRTTPVLFQTCWIRTLHSVTHSEHLCNFQHEVFILHFDVAVTSLEISQPTILVGYSWILRTDITAKQRLHWIALCFRHYTFYSSTINDTIKWCLVLLILWEIQLLSVQFCSVLYCAVLFWYFTMGVCYDDVITSQKLWLTTVYACMLCVKALKPSTLAKLLIT
jgi:hypothetical protein